MKSYGNGRVVKGLATASKVFGKAGCSFNIVKIDALFYNKITDFPVPSSFQKNKTPPTMENSEGKTPRPPHHPHDMLFKAVFKQPSNVRELLEAKAPKPLLAILDLGSLRLTDASYVDAELAKQMADIVLECDTDEGSPVRFSFILEHKSYVPTYPPLQVMRYQGLAWAMQIGSENSRPAPLVPVVFFHGKDKWTVKPWKDYLEGWREEFAPFTPPGG
ncbi:MAG TPA: hypothetical protein ENJ95_10930, partial [Bacteroidetes bacterium]|nr:hypothetical protein [Bacteroidota bacterium]